MTKGKLTFFCGKMGVGKSTKAMELEKEEGGVLISEDEWLSALYPNKILSINDYVEYSSLLKSQIKKLVQAILTEGTNVIMDFPANTVTQRNWFRSVFTEIDAQHNLVFIDLPNEVCLSQIEKRRREQPERAATDTPIMFEQITKYFVAPSLDEGFNITIVTGSI